MGETDYTTFLDDEETSRLRVRIQASGGALEAFVIQLETLVDGEWREVVRYDNAHGVAHRDELDLRGRATKKELNLVDLKTAITYARQDLTDRWTWYRDRFLASGRGRRRR
jgi:hypothetical protein